MPHDIAVGTANLPTVAPTIKRPAYLVILVDSKKETFFIATDRPGFENSFITVRGIYSDLTEDEIVKKFSEILVNAPKDSVLELMLPAHRVKSIRSLVFNAVKPTMITR
jgi:hypothetical protein